jgi:hypothetical protein
LSGPQEKEDIGEDTWKTGKTQGKTPGRLDTRKRRHKGAWEYPREDRKYPREDI